jgi:hypothetical protein
MKLQHPYETQLDCALNGVWLAGLILLLCMSVGCTSTQFYKDGKPVFKTCSDCYGVKVNPDGTMSIDSIINSTSTAQAWAGASEFGSTVGTSVVAGLATHGAASGFSGFVQKSVPVTASAVKKP